MTRFRAIALALVMVGALGLMTACASDPCGCGQPNPCGCPNPCAQPNPCADPCPNPCNTCDPCAPAPAPCAPAPAPAASCGGGPDGAKRPRSLRLFFFVAFPTRFGG
jgi:hypothetical protein